MSTDKTMTEHDLDNLPEGTCIRAWFNGLGYKYLKSTDRMPQGANGPWFSYASHGYATSRLLAGHGAKVLSIGNAESVKKAKAA